MKKKIIIALKNYQLACMADPAHEGRIGLARQLVVLKSNDGIFFDAHFVSICLKSFKKSAFPTLSHFFRVREALQSHVLNIYCRGKLFNAQTQLHCPSEKTKEKKRRKGPGPQGTYLQCADHSQCIDRATLPIRVNHQVLEF